jgi:DNA-binding SARP family transcriptional activator
MRGIDRRRTMPRQRSETTGIPTMHQHSRHQSKEHRTNCRNHVTIRLLGAFEVTVDGVGTPDHRWSRRTAASLVKLLALAPGHRLHREQVIDILWPDESAAEAAPRLHKAAHYARKATGCRDAVVLRNDVVHLFPTAHVAVDVTTFEELARRAISGQDAAIAREAVEHYGGELLPDDRYEDWAMERRELLRLRHLNVLRVAGEWLDVTEADHGDEQAHLELIRDHVATGDTVVALAHYRRLEQVLGRDLGVAPGPVARQLRAAIEAADISVASAPPAVEDLVTELVELTRRQTDLLWRLAATSSALASACGACA